VSRTATLHNVHSENQYINHTILNAYQVKTAKIITHPPGPPLLKIEGDDHPAKFPLLLQEKGLGDEFGKRAAEKAVLTG